MTCCTFNERKLWCSKKALSRFSSHIFSQIFRFSPLKPAKTVEAKFLAHVWSIYHFCVTWSSHRRESKWAMSWEPLGLARLKKHFGWNQCAILPSNIGDWIMMARRRLFWKLERINSLKIGTLAPGWWQTTAADVRQCIGDENFLLNLTFKPTGLVRHSVVLKQATQKQTQGRWKITFVSNCNANGPYKTTKYHQVTLTSIQM